MRRRNVLCDESGLPLTRTNIGPKIGPVGLTTAIEPIASLKNSSARLVSKIKKTGQPLYITQNGKPVAVLVDIESFERQRKALLLYRHLSCAENDIKSGRVFTDEEAQERLGQKLKSLSRVPHTISSTVTSGGELMRRRKVWPSPRLM